MPTQSNSWRNRVRPPSSALAPCDTTSGWIRSRRSARTHRTPVPFGPHSHLWPLPVQYAAPSASMSSGEHPGRVRAVDERVDAAPVELGDELRDGQDERGRAGHLADEDQPGPLRDRTEDRLERLGRPADRERDPRDDDPGPVPLRDRAQRVDRGVVLVVVGQQLVARLEPQRPEDRVDPGRGIRHEREAVRVRVEERADRRPRRIEQPRQVAAQEAHGLGLEAVAQPALDGEDRLGAGPVRPVVEERDRGVEPPAEVGPHTGMTGVSIRSPSTGDLRLRPRRGEPARLARTDDAPGDGRPAGAAGSSMTPVCSASPSAPRPSGAHAAKRSTVSVQVAARRAARPRSRARPSGHPCRRRGSRSTTRRPSPRHSRRPARRRPRARR